MKVLIIEDEQLAANRLSRMLQKIEPDVEILTTLDTVSESVEWLKENEADLIFMDIQLADGNSFGIFEQVDIFTPIIFATAFDQYAIKAFDVNSIDYLLKPVKQEKLEQSLQKFKRRQSSSDESMMDVAGLMKALNPNEGQSYKKRFLVSAGDKIKSVPIEDVAYFYGQKRYVFLITKENRRHIVDYTLGKLETMLDPDQFFRINRQFIISYKAIENMYPYSKSKVRCELLPASDVEAIVSTDRVRNFKNWLNM